MTFPTVSNSAACFPLLIDPESYRPCETDLLADTEAREYWLDVFERHTDVLLSAAADSGYTDEAIQAVAVQWSAEMREFRRLPARLGRLDILTLDEHRRSVFDHHGISDEFRTLKARENIAAARALPVWLSTLDELNDASQRFGTIVRGMLAGNLFDMGVPEMVQHFRQQTMPLGDALDRVPSRPWLVDHLHEATDWIRNRHLGKAVIFADNAGGDFVLGVIPLIRFLLECTDQVIIAANAAPSHNDVTVGMVRHLLDDAASLDARLSSERIRVRSNAHAAPLLDLRRVSAELAADSAGADLVVLIGMGRSIESNLRARFTCPSWKIAMVKDACVARTVGGKMMDAVFRFEQSD